MNQTDKDKLDAFNGVADTLAFGRCRIFLRQAIKRGQQEMDWKYVNTVRKELAAIQKCIDVVRGVVAEDEPEPTPPAPPPLPKPAVSHSWAVNLIEKGKRK